MKKFLLVAILGLMAFTGCTSNELTITKCKSYKDGICVSKEIRDVKLCKNPVKVNGKTYCDK